MCVIAVCRKKIDKDTFERCFNKNKDGFGFAYVKDGLVNYKKGMMTLDEAWNEYKKHTFNKFFDGCEYNHVIHFRLGNPVCKELTHPFIVNEDSTEMLEYVGEHKVLFHNGTISSWKDLIIPVFLKIGKIISGSISDTRLAAILVNVLGDNILTMISGKYVILDRTYFRTFGTFEKDDNGNLFSNDSYKKSVTYVSREYYKPELLKTHDDFFTTQEFVI